FAAAHTNLAMNLIRLGRFDAALLQLKKSVVLDPRTFDSNHNLGELYVRMGKLTEAIPYLKRAQEITPAYDNADDPAVAETKGYGGTSQPAGTSRREGRQLRCGGERIRGCSSSGSEREQFV